MVIWHAGKQIKYYVIFLCFCFKNYFNFTFLLIISFPSTQKPPQVREPRFGKPWVTPQWIFYHIKYTIWVTKSKVEFFFFFLCKDLLDDEEREMVKYRTFPRSTDDFVYTTYHDLNSVSSAQL